MKTPKPDFIVQLLGSASLRLRINNLHFGYAWVLGFGVYFNAKAQRPQSLISAPLRLRGKN